MCRLVKAQGRGTERKAQCQVLAAPPAEAHQSVKHTHTATLPPALHHLPHRNGLPPGQLACRHLLLHRLDRIPPPDAGGLAGCSRQRIGQQSASHKLQQQLYLR